MKKHELIFGLLRLPIEFLVVFGSFFLAREIRLVTDLIPTIQLQVQTIDSVSLFYFALWGAVLMMVLFAIHGLYKIRITHSRVQEVLDVVRYQFYWFLFYIAILYLSNGFLYETQIPRLIVFFSFILSTVGIIIIRTIINSIQLSLVKNGYAEQRNCVVYMDVYSEKFIEELQKTSLYNCVGYIGKKEHKKSGLTYLGTATDIEHILRRHNIDEILFLNGDVHSDNGKKLFHITRVMWVRFSYASNTFESTKSNTSIFLLGRIPFVEIQSIGLDSWGRIIKRLCDIVFSSLVIIIGFIPGLIIALIIFLSDGHAPIYKSRRVGRWWEDLFLYKFRTMVPNAEKLKKELLAKNERTDGPLFKMENDPRITKIGKFLRRFDIDEFPQFINVFKGEMSVIGPRPHLPDEVSKYEFDQQRVLTIKPGVSGMAQVHGRHRNSFQKEVELDIFYIENWSLLLDIKIFLRTIKVAFFHR